MLFGRKKADNVNDPIELLNKTADEVWSKVVGPNILTEFNQNFELFAYLRNDNKKSKDDAHDRCLKLLKETPGFLFSIDEEGHNIMERMVLINEVGRFLSLLVESENKEGVSLNVLTDNKFLKEPLCFSVFQSTQSRDIERVNKIIVDLKVDPVNSENVKWSKIYKKGLQEREKNRVEGQKKFDISKNKMINSHVKVRTEEQRSK